MITQKELKDKIIYNPDTGFFYRKLSGDLAGWVTKEGYISLKIDYITYKAHRLAFLYMTGELPEDQVDHINNIKGDNRWENLRRCSQSENQRNTGKRRNNTSGVKNVSWNSKNRKWRITLYLDGKNKCFGSYEDLEVAEIIAAELRHYYHGDFTRHT